ncbi:MAG: NFACT family protein [Lachnospiraceae bacterium]|nr:NFACT family protein [Lachnospiraceae bacterium]
MAFDGITTAALCSELNRRLSGGRISKVAQPESDELQITVNTPEGNLKLLLSADASLPLVYITESSKKSPLNAPNFCMVLRKRLQGGRVISVSQPGLERAIRIDAEHLDEMGDVKRVSLVTEIMGKHSNIILTEDDNGTERIIDSIKHVSLAVSSVREVLPGREYFIPNTMEKEDLLSSSADDIRKILSAYPGPVFKGIYTSFTGLSPLAAHETAFDAGVDGDAPVASLSDEEMGKLVSALVSLKDRILAGEFSPCIAYTGGKPQEYAAFALDMYRGPEDSISSIDSMSTVLEKYYSEKQSLVRMNQKSSDLKRVVKTLIERDSHTLDEQTRQLQKTEDRDKYRIWGELLNAFGYSAEPGAKEITVDNYYTNEKETIPLDPTLSAQETAVKYFDRYTKLKRTAEALAVQTENVKERIEHLESILASIGIAESEEDLAWIRRELSEAGYVREHVQKGKPVKLKGEPYHYISSDGYDIYVGRNNIQNDQLTFKFAVGADWWFHAKKIPGSHVVLKVKEPGEELPDRAFEEAAALAAYYSAGREQSKVDIDYVLKKEVKKPSGAKPGFVVYYTNYSMTISPDISALKEV